jgi:hypothetical protein
VLAKYFFKRKFVSLWSKKVKDIMKNLQKAAGKLFDYAAATNMSFFGFEGEPSGYFLIFIFCSIAYLIGWLVMKALVPEYKPIAE